MVKILNKYLGISLGAKYKDLRTWDAIVTRHERRLIGWQRNLLSKGGHLNFIKSILSNLSVYNVPFNNFGECCKEIESNSEQISMRDSEERRKYHLVTREVLERSLHQSG